MKFKLLIDVGRFEVGPIEIPDEELDRMRAKYPNTFPNNSALLHSVAFERYEVPLRKRLQAVEGAETLDFNEVTLLIQSPDDEDIYD
jgi:hypothetical protein